MSLESLKEVTDFEKSFAFNKNSRCYEKETSKTVLDKEYLEEQREVSCI